MGQFNELQRPDLAQFVRKYLAEVGEFSSFSPELGVGIVVEQDRPEWSFPKRELLWSIGRDVPASVGNISKVRIRNITTDGIVVIGAIAGNAGLATSIIMQINRPQVGDLGGVLAVVALDTRQASRNTAVNTSFDNTALPTGDIFFKDLIVASQTIFWPPSPPTQTNMGIVLAPGDSVDIATDVTNIRLLVDAVGYSRKARAEELTV